MQPYSCPEKLSIIRSGLKRFEPKPEIKSKPKKGRGGRKKASKPDPEPEKPEEGEKKKDGLFDLRAK